MRQHTKRPPRYFTFTCDSLNEAFKLWDMFLLVWGRRWCFTDHIFISHNKNGG